MSECILQIARRTRVSTKLHEQDVLWRYLDAAKFLDFVHNQTLHFSRGDKFDDKHEGAFTKSLKQKFESAYRDLDNNCNYEEFRKRLRERVFVNCWHKSVDDSMAMWSIYGRSSCAVTIVTTVGRLKKSLEGAKIPHEIAIEQVEYIEHLADPDLDIKPYSKVFAYKNKAYRFEKEVRVLIDRHFDEFKTEILEVGMSVNVSAENLLVEIVIAPEALPWFEQLVKDVAKHYGISAPVRRSLLATEPV